MTAGHLLRVLLRRWYVLLLAAILTAVVVGLLGRVPGVYSTQVDLVFLPPNSANALGVTNDSLVQFAAVVEREFIGGRDDDPISTTGGTLYGQGVRVGWRVNLPNAGGQWNNNFNRPALSVEVVDATPARVDAVVQNLTERIQSVVRQVQDGQGVPRIRQVETLQSPSSAVVSYIDGNRTRASLAVALLGAVLGISATVAFDTLRVRHEPAARRPNMFTRGSKAHRSRS
jgi:hypothetical protein